ncbi:MAG TPA: glycosyltransferase family 4 protein [Solirubrobacterales bacterium]|jgi:glycosyltransferase involved in cell wall biosynthesis|nr:glycosyltransferase family 4 protein [Solirubrobacterales bacterium]
MRVLFSIHHDLDPDTGAPGATIALGEHLAETGNQIDYLSFDDMPVKLPFMAATIAYPYFAAAKLAGRAAQAADVIDSSTGDAWAWARLDRRRRRPLLVTRSHGLEHLFQEREVEQARHEGRKLSWRYPLYWGGWRLREVALSLRASDLVFVLSEAERDYVSERLGVDPERVRLTANGVPDSFLAKAVETNGDAGGPAVAWVGAYRRSKGVEHGTAALATAMEADPDLRVSFFGPGVPPSTVRAPFPPRLHERVAVIEHYHREELPKLLCGHSIAFVPSLSEGFSLALVEVMACGLAPVASDIPGNRETVVDGENGLLTSAGDAAAATAAIQRLRADPELLGRLRKAARVVGERYSWKRIAADTASAYEEAIERREHELAPAGGAGR